MKAKRQRGGNPHGCTHTHTHTQLNLTDKEKKKEKIKDRIKSYRFSTLLLRKVLNR